MKVVGIKFKNSSKIYYFDPIGIDNIEVNDGVIVETARGIEYGIVMKGITDVDDDEIVQPLKPIIRVATPEDEAQRLENAAKEAEAFEICLERIAAHGIKMKLIDVEYTFNAGKIIFYFTAGGRVDFRELVKDLASIFKTRIELRQIGVRDETKLLGGVGCCGRPVCCKQFLSDFQPISIKMAKEQGLSLSPTKISGLCGRLMCCLKYEQECYEQTRRKMPRIGNEVETPDGNGTVVENNIILEKSKVKILLSDGSYDLREYPVTEIKVIGRGSAGCDNCGNGYDVDYDDYNDEDLKDLED